MPWLEIDTRVRLTELAGVREDHPLAAQLYDIPGVEYARIDRYRATIEYGAAFSAEEVDVAARKVVTAWIEGAVVMRRVFIYGLWAILLLGMPIMWVVLCERVPR